MPKYRPLGAWLEQQRAANSPTIKLSFAQVEEHIQGRLPRSAFQRDLWWTAMDPTNASHAVKGWLRAGWMVAQVDVQERLVTFVDAGRKVAALYREGCDSKASQVAL